MTDDAKAFAETDAKAIADLKAEVDQLKAALAPTPNDAAAVGKWKDEMHELAERRAAAHLPFSRADLDAMRAAAPDDVVRNIAMRDNRAPTGPSSAGASGQTTRVSTSPGIPGSGWRNSPPLGPVAGLRYVDAQLDAQDQKDRRELIERKAKEQALLKAAEEAK
jgi:hypothetical protein